MRVITVVSGKGGVGKTTIVANLGVALARRGRRVLLLDCNLLNPDLRLHLGVSWHPLSLQEALLRGVEFEEAAAEAWGVDLLPCVPGITAGLDTLPWRLEAARGYDAVIIDTAPGIGALNRALLERSDLALLVTSPDPVGQMDAGRIEGQIPVPVQRVVNRAENGGAREGLGVGLWLGMEECLRVGIPLVARAPEGPAAREFAKMARRVLPWQGPGRGPIREVPLP